MTIQDAVDTIRKNMHDPGPGTVDTIKVGDTQAELKGVVLTFMATYAVLKQAADTGANLIISHEPIRYSHLDETDWLENDPVYEAKKQFVEEHGMVIWRLHDAMHRGGWPDDIATGMLDALGWLDYVDHERPNILHVPAQPLSAIVEHCNQKVGLGTTRIAGNPDATISTIALKPGASGGRSHMTMLQQADVDLIICGEAPEWETCEYVRDAVEAGLNKAMITLGHVASEEAGMSHFVAQVEQWLPEATVTHIPAGSAIWQA